VAPAHPSRRRERPGANPCLPSLGEPAHERASGEARQDQEPASRTSEPEGARPFARRAAAELAAPCRACRSEMVPADRCPPSPPTATLETRVRHRRKKQARLAHHRRSEDGEAPPVAGAAVDSRFPLPRQTRAPAAGVRPGPPPASSRTCHRTGRRPGASNRSSGKASSRQREASRLYSTSSSVGRSLSCSSQGPSPRTRRRPCRRPRLRAEGARASLRAPPRGPAPSG
jgi:hypothetical protein